jgi:hypothetical protein
MILISKTIQNYTLFGIATLLMKIMPAGKVLLKKSSRYFSLKGLVNPEDYTSAKYLCQYLNECFNLCYNDVKEDSCGT